MTLLFRLGVLALVAPPPLIFGQLVITTQSVPYGSVGTAYSVTITSTASTAATWAITAGSLPPRLLLTGAKGSSATISGTPTNGGVFAFSITVTDPLFNNASATKAFSIGIFAITTKSPLPAALVGSAYSAAFAAANTPGPYTWSVVVAGTLPPGLSLSPQGILSGTPTAANTYSFTIFAVDSAAQAHATALFSITVNAPTGPLLQVSPLSLSFSGVLGGSAPTPQAISILSPGGGAVNFAASVDSGVPGSGSPGWIKITPANDSAPGRVTVTVNAGRLVTGMVSAVIHITAPNNTSQVAIDVRVTFNVSSAPPQLGSFPNAVRFGAVVDNQFPQSGFVFVTNDGGGGTIKVAARVLRNSSWITGVTPGQGNAGPDQPLVIRVDVNTQGLQVGLYHDILQLTSTTGNKGIPVTVFVSEAGATLELGSRGLHFQLRQGHGSTLPQSISVLDLGDPSSVVNWKAELLSGVDFLQVVTPTGVATPAKPGVLTLAPTSGAANLSAGSHYALLRVSDPQALASPRYHTVVFDVAGADAPAMPDFSPGGMLFTTTSAPQDVLIYTSSVAPVSFQAAPHTEDGLPWLVATPASGTASTAAPGRISISVTPAGLTAGIHYGGVSVAMSGSVFHVNVTLIVPPGTIFDVPPSTAVPVRAAGTTCVPSALALTATGLVNNFSVPAGWPASLIAQLNDDCGNPITDGDVVATFSNGDPPLTLRGDHNTNVHSASWQPGAVFPEMTITLRASKGTLSPAIRQFIGAVNQNNEPAPALIPGGFLHIFFNKEMAATLGPGLAPGNVAQVYGTGLASITSSTFVPLPNQFSGTFMLIGDVQAPLFFVSDVYDLLNIEVPAELTPNRQYSVIVSANNSLTLPETLTVVPMQPGVAQFSDGTVIAQISGTTTLISASNPAKPGQSLTIYLAGMGATNPTVTSGQPTPLQLVPAVTQPVVTLNGENVNVAYAGLTPTGVGLYQINFTVPADAPSGVLELVVTQNGIVANTTKLPVGSN